MDLRVTEVLSELGRRLEDYGDGDARRAAANIARDMLDPEALAGWMALYPALPVAVPRNVLIIMAGNIPFVGMQDLVCVLAAGHRAIVKPSSRDLENISRAVSQLLDIEPGLPVSLLSEDAPAPDAVIAMGGNDTVAAIAEKYADVPVLLRGSRSSAAVLDGHETDDELAGLADDILSYSGLGCRNVSLVFVPREYNFLRLHYIMCGRTGSLEAGYRNNLRQAEAILVMNGTRFIHCGSCVMIENKDFSSRPGVLHYAFYDDPAEVKRWGERHDAKIQCVACGPHHAGIHPRSVPLGGTQRPRLTDYPDGRDTMQFLMSI